jgi:antibiotic biosynthesis monooxygenase (ABM) superfamily enzyme
MESTDKMGPDAVIDFVNPTKTVEADMKRLGRHTWFSVCSSGSSNGDNAPSSPPVRYKMAILMTAVIFVLLNILPPAIQLLTMGLPVLLSTLVGVAIMVLLMNYV